MLKPKTPKRTDPRAQRQKPIQFQVKSFSKQNSRGQKPIDNLIVELEQMAGTNEYDELDGLAMLAQPTQQSFIDQYRQFALKNNNRDEKTEPKLPGERGSKELKQSRFGSLSQYDPANMDSIEQLAHDIVQNNKKINQLLGQQPQIGKSQAYESMLPDFDVTMDTDRIMEALLRSDIAGIPPPQSNKDQVGAA